MQLQHTSTRATLALKPSPRFISRILSFYKAMADRSIYGMCQFSINRHTKFQILLILKITNYSKLSGLNIPNSLATNIPNCVARNISNCLARKIPNCLAKNIPNSLASNIPNCLATNIPNCSFKNIPNFLAINIPNSLAINIPNCPFKNILSCLLGHKYSNMTL